MSVSIRQSNLFTAEDYKKVFQAYNFIDYTAYDPDTLKQALLNYIRTYYPENFNDYIESSEFIAIIELIAYLGTSLAFRSDMNSRENFIDTAERRESIIRLAQMVNYVPRRNIAASGLFKITAVHTNQPLTDSNGIAINDTAIFWNDPNNPDWFDQFIQVCNAAFSSPNPFGRPAKSGTIGSIPTDLYELNSVPRINVTYPTVVNVNGEQFPVDVCNPDFVSGEAIFERDPDPMNAFNVVYRNDSLGVGSSNTGFFLYFKQGTLVNFDTNFEYPVPNRLYPITTQNINQDDVYVQSTDQDGNALAKWKKVPALYGENIVYNSIRYSERNIFDVVSGANDTISIRFADGNFGNVPTGLFRVWARTSANQSLVIRPDSAQGLRISIPYIGADGQNYTLRVVFGLEQTVSNAAPAETNDQIKLRAPEVFSTQSRMVNGSDYNILPLIHGNQIAKIKALERTYSGQSRYIDMVDPTGFHRDLIILGQDGTIYRDDKNILTQLTPASSNERTTRASVIAAIQATLESERLNTFFYDEYLTQFEDSIRVNPPFTGRSLLDLSGSDGAALFWKASPLRAKSTTGYFACSTLPDAPSASLTNSVGVSNVVGGTYNTWGLIKPGAVLEFIKPTDASVRNSVSVKSVLQSGTAMQTLNSQNSYAELGPVELSGDEPNNYRVSRVYPVFRTSFTSVEYAAIENALTLGNSFWLYYDLLRDTWGISTSASDTISIGNFTYPAPANIGGVPGIYSTWGATPTDGLIFVNALSGGQAFDIVGRGRTLVFQSYKDVRFYWDPASKVVHGTTGLESEDTIEILPYVNTDSAVLSNVTTDASTTYLREPVTFTIAGAYVQDDGYLDASKVAVSLIDGNNDGIPDQPGGFDMVVSRNDRVVFEYHTDPLTGYQSSRPWVAKWGTELGDTAGQTLYVYFPISPVNDAELYGAPYIANQLIPTNASTGTVPYRDPYVYQLSNPQFKYVYLDEADLIFINRVEQMNYTAPGAAISIANQLTAFLNGPTNAELQRYPWLAGTEKTNNKLDILRGYFLNKSFMIGHDQLPGSGVFYRLTTDTSSNTNLHPSGEIITVVPDLYHYDRNGKTFTQNMSITDKLRVPLHFKWSHYSPVDQRIDPSPSNIIDMIAITNSYFNDIQTWKNVGGTLTTLPKPPSTEELRIQFQSLDQYKMLSDSIVWNSGKFKLLFGTQAAPELQAIFKVVKSPSANVSDNEVKIRVIEAIDTYFDIRNWDFGEKFFYTELAAYIHQQLSRVISSVVIVPKNANSRFGDLFEIVATEVEIFMSTATAANVSIISNLTEQSLRG